MFIRMDEAATLFTGTKGVEDLSLWEKRLVGGAVVHRHVLWRACLYIGCATASSFVLMILVEC